MSIKRTIITAIVGLTLVAVVAPAMASAQSVAQLQAEIAQLTAALTQLQGTSAAASNSGAPAACAGVTFDRNLRVGSVGQDVKCLQAILNSSATTQVAATGAGSPGSETTSFGSKTLIAVKKFQAAQGLTPANQVGPVTRQKLSAWIAGSSVSNTNTGSNTGTGTGTTQTTTGPVSAALAADSPAAGAIVNNQASADLLHINFTGNGTVTSVTLQRSGISDQNALTNVYLYDGNVRITDGYSFNVSGQLVMNGLNLAINGSKTISVKADVASSASTLNSSIGAKLTSYTAGSATAANVAGNLMQIVTGNLAAASLNANTVTGSPTVNAGTSQYTFWSAPLQVNTRSVLLKVANFKMIGSAPSDALSNINLFVDGVNTGKTAVISPINGSTYAVFDITSAPITLTTGSHTIEMRADVQKGTNRNVTVSIQQASDLTVTDPQVNVNIAITGTVPNNAAQITINTGSATVSTSSAFTSMTNVSGGATNAVIGQFTVHAYGEDVKVSTLSATPSLTTVGTTQATATSNAAGTTATIVNAGAGYVTTPTVTVSGGTCGTLPSGTATISGGKVISVTLTGAVTCTVAPTITIAAPTFPSTGLNNVTLYFNGSQIGSQQNWTSGALTFQLGSQMILPAGQDSTLEVRADLQTTSNVSYTAGTVGVVLNAGSSNAQGQNSQNSVNFPSASVTPNTLTIQSSVLAVSKNSGFAGQSITPNTTGAKIGSYIIQNQSTSQSIRLSSFRVATTNSSTNGMNDLSALRTSDTTGSGSTPIQPTGNDTFSVSDVLAPGAQMILDIFANTGSDASGTIQTTLTVTSIGSVDNISSTSAAQTGQAMVLGTGTVGTPTLVVSSTTPSQYIAAAGGATNATQATFNFVSTNGTSTITELKFTVTGSDADISNAITNICIGTVCASPVSGVADLTGLQIAVPNGGGGATVNAQISYSSVGTGGINPSTTSNVALTYVKAQPLGAAVQVLTPNVTAYQVTLVGSKPTVTVVSTSNSGLILNTEALVGQVTVAADPKGAIKVNTITFSVGYSANTGGTPTSIASARIANGNTTIPGTSCTPTGTSVITCTLGLGYTSDYQINAGQSQTFNLYATTVGLTAAGTNAVSISSSVTPAGFLWDDTSTNGLTGTLLTGTNVYNFPTNSYSIHQ